MKIISSTRGLNRTVPERMKWGVLMGSAEIFAGVVNLFSLGMLASNLPLDVAFKLADAEWRKHQENQRTS